MAECRDWLKTLWPASYKGVGFFFESDAEEGGRGLVIHEFPNRDDPYVEDLGEAPRFFEGSAYVHGDLADAAAVALTEMFATRGAGTLVVPIRGPVQVHTQSFKREHRKDQLGYVAFSVKFVRAGSAFGLISIPHLASLAFGAAGGLIQAAAATFANTAALVGFADHVVGEAVSGIQGALTALDAMRLSEPVDPRVSARVRDAIDVVLDRVPELMPRVGTATAASVDEVYEAIRLFEPRPDVEAAAVETTAGPFAAAFAVGVLTRAVADAIAPEIAARATRALAQDSVVRLAPSYLSPSAKAAAENGAAAARVLRIAALTALAEAVVRRTYRSRPEGVNARAEVSTRFDAELGDAGGAANAELFLAIQDVRGRVVEFLTRTITDLAPVVTVSAQRRLPSLCWAWRLYANPMRAGELVDRSGAVHPSFMPREFQALAR